MFRYVQCFIKICVLVFECKTQIFPNFNIAGLGV